MPSRMASGKTTNRFDNETHYETLDKMVTITDKLDRVVDTINDPIKVGIERLQNRCDALEAENSAIRTQLVAENSAIRTQLAEMSTKYDALRAQVRAFLTSRFFRFLNFFGRWFIYAPDGGIYANTPENRHFVESMHSTPKTEGLRSHDSENDDILTILDLTNGHGRSFRLFRFKGTLDGAKEELKRRHIDLQLGDHLETLGDGKSYIWATDMTDTCDLYEVGKLPYLDDYGNF